MAVGDELVTTGELNAALDLFAARVNAAFAEAAATGHAQVLALAASTNGAMAELAEWVVNTVNAGRRPAVVVEHPPPAIPAPEVTVVQAPAPPPPPPSPPRSKTKRIIRDKHGNISRIVEEA